MSWWRSWGWASSHRGGGRAHSSSSPVNYSLNPLSMGEKGIYPSSARSAWLLPGQVKNPFRRFQHDWPASDTRHKETHSETVVAWKTGGISPLCAERGLSAGCGHRCSRPQFRHQLPEPLLNMISQEFFSSDNTITPTINSRDANGKTLYMKDSGDKNLCVQLASTAAPTKPNNTNKKNKRFALKRQQHLRFSATTLHLYHR
jgi:hypothetical protein